MKDIVADTSLVAFCGLYCGACRSHLKGKCPGCRENIKATWCTVRTCCLERSYASCADCVDFTDTHACKKMNNPIARLFGLIFRSDRHACIEAIRVGGCDAFAHGMADKKARTITVK